MSNLFGSVEGFYAMFGEYNLAVWPMPVVMYMLALAAVILTLRKRPWSGTVISLILCFFWLWNGIVFSLVYFARFNPIFYLTAVLFVFQGVLFLLNGIGLGVKSKLFFRFRTDTHGWLGILFVLYAMVFYALIGWATGRAYPVGPIFGTAPCPMSIFTVGLLLLVDKKVPVVLLIVPFLWGVCGILPVIVYGVFADIGLVVSGIAVLLLILHRK